MKKLIALLLCWPLWAGAATYYIDPTAPDGGDGSEGSPWNSRDDITIGSNNTYLFKRGTTSIWTDRLQFASRTGVTIGAYGTGDPPQFQSYIETSTGDWSETAGQTNVWEYAMPTGATAYFVMFGNLGQDYHGTEFDYDGSAAYPDEAFGWAGDTETGGTPGRILVYSEGNPVTVYGAVYVNHFTTFDFTNSTNTTVSDIDCWYVGVCVRALSSSGTTYDGVTFSDINIYHSTHGIFVQGNTSSRGFTSVSVSDIDCDYALRTCYYQFGIAPAGVLENYTFARCGSLRSQGCIYLDNGESDPPFTAKNGVIDSPYFGVFWPSDGGCAEIDSNGGGFIFTQNICKGAHELFHDNSGKPNIEVTSNLGINVDKLYVHSDSDAVGESDVLVARNTIVGCGANKLADSGDKACVDLDSMQTGTNTVTVENNAVHAADGAVDGISINAAGTSGNAVDSYNLVYNTQYVRRKGTSEESAGTGTLTSDPKLVGGGSAGEAYQLRPGVDSPLCDAGTFTAGADAYDGKQFTIPYPIGAFRCESRVDATSSNMTRMQ